MVVSKSNSDSEYLRKLTENMQALIIIDFIKENQNGETALTMDRVAKAMHDKGVCSRTTTLKLIDSMLQARVLIDQKRKLNEFHDLAVSDEIDFRPLLKQKFLDYVEDIKKEYEPFESLIGDKKFKDKVEKSVSEIKKAVDNI